MKEKVAELAWFFVIGMIVMTGFRAVEYVIPEPASRLYVCMIGEDDNAEICKTLAELRDKHGT